MQKKYPWTDGPWLLRTHPALPPFVEAPRSKQMAYALDVCGDDYTGYGDEEQRSINMELISLCPEMAEAIITGNAELIKSKLESFIERCKNAEND